MCEYMDSDFMCVGQVLQKISISNKCYSFELFIHQILKRLKDSLDIKHQNSDSNQNFSWEN